jgi:hypothetical protein
MRRWLIVFLLFASLVGGAQLEPASWYQYLAWQQSLASGDVDALTQFFTQHATTDASMRHPFRQEAAVELELLARVGGDLKWYKYVNVSETEMHAILKGKDEKSWVEAVLHVDKELPNNITAIELRQIAGPKPEINDGHPMPRPNWPQLISPKNDEAFSQSARDITVRWTAVPEATGYWLEWDFKDGGVWHAKLPGATVVRIELVETSYTLPFVRTQMVRWRVIAFDERGVAGEPSEWREFRYLQ